MDSLNTHRSTMRPSLTPEQVKSAWDRQMAEMRENQSAMETASELGEPALQRLLELCETRDSGQIHKIARLLAGLYNGYAYPFDFTDLRCLDRSILNDCISVIRMDACPQKEVHRYFENGDARWQTLIAKFGISPVERR